MNISRELGLKNTTDNPIDFAAPGFGLAGFSGTGGGFNLQTITNRYILADNITHITGGHTIKAGFELRYVRLMEETSTFANGSLAFSGQFTSQTLDGGASLVPDTGSSVADFLLGFPTSGAAAFGDPLVHFRFTQAGFYAQDDWKVTPDFTLQLGLRYEPTSFPESERGNVYLFDLNTGETLFPSLGQVPSGVIDPPHKEFGPRVGFAWNPSFDRKMTIRAGYGIYFDVTQLNELQFLNFGPPFFNLQFIAQPAGNPAPRFELGVNTYPDVDPPPIEQGFRAPDGTGPFSVDPNLQTPTVYQWNFTIQRELPADLLLEVGYFGSNGRHLSRRYDADQCSLPDSLRCDPSARRFPNLSGIFLTTSNAWSDYQGLHTRLERRFSHGVKLLMGYTWQKSFDTDSGASFATPTQRSANLNDDKGLSNMHINHRYTFSGLWELPFGRGRAFGNRVGRGLDLLIGGWQLGAIGAMQTGPAHDPSGNNLTGDTSINFKRIDCTGQPALASGSLRDNGLQWVNPAAFARPAVGFFGNCGRSVFTGPGIINWDLSILKNFSLTERVNLQFRFEYFNAFNHASFNVPVSDINSPIFGKVTGAQRARVGQFGLKLNF